jgi:hypothetical protein
MHGQQNINIKNIYLVCRNTVISAAAYFAPSNSLNIHHVVWLEDLFQLSHSSDVPIHRMI